MPASARNCRGRLCGSIVKSRKLERKRRFARWNEPAPVPTSSWPRNSRQAWRHQTKRKFELVEPSRPPPFPTAPDPPPLTTTKTTAAPTATTAAGEQAAAKRRRDPGPRQPLQQHGRGRPGEQQHAEDEAVAPPHVIGLAVARHPGQQERDRRDDTRRHAGSHERHGALRALVRQREPRDDHDDSGQDPAARVRQQERDDPAEGKERSGEAPPPERKRQRERAEQGELVPQAHRSAQPRQPGRSVVVHGRQHLARERPDHDCSEQDAETVRKLSRPRGEPEPERREEEVDEGPVGVVPRAVGQQRPRDRQPEPGGEGGEGQQREQPAGHPLGGEQQEPDQQGAASEPHERAVSGAAAEEDRGSCEGERRGERQFPDRPHLARSYHPPATCPDRSQKPYSAVVRSAFSCPP